MREPERQGDVGGAAASVPLVVFVLDGQRYALDLAATERVLPMVAVSPLPGCPDQVLGAMNLHGEVIPVLDIRRRLGLEPVEYGPAARLLVARAARRRVGLPADEVIGVVETPTESVVPPESVIAGIGGVAGVAALADGLVLIQDLGAFLTLDEEARLGAALGEEGE